MPIIPVNIVENEINRLLSEGQNIVLTPDMRQHMAQKVIQNIETHPVNDLKEISDRIALFADPNASEMKVPDNISDIAKKSSKIKFLESSDNRG